jgi:hypothetical protein
LRQGVGCGKPDHPGSDDSHLGRLRRHVP